MAVINLGKTIPGKKLETVLLEAAKELGFKAKVKDYFKTEYELGSVEKKKVYDDTTITLRKHFRHIGRLSFNREEDRDWLILCGYPGYSEKKIIEYLGAVSGKI